jgi:aconitate hydratase
MRSTGRSEADCGLFEAYFRAQGLFGIPRAGQIDYSRSVRLDLSTIVPSLAGPKRPQDRIALPEMASRFNACSARPNRPTASAVRPRPWGSVIRPTGRASISAMATC